VRKPFLWLWVLWLLVGTTFEVWAVWFRHGGDDTLSETTVWIFHAQTVVGWFALMILMGFLAAWFPSHVRHLAQMKQASEAKRKARAAEAAGDENDPA
jgi:hypothetical protein